MPLSRRLLAVPFVGKDVPSRASEFANPEVLIGLTVLAYRYEGMRLGDVTHVVKQMKADLAFEVGPFSQRPSCILFAEWTEQAAVARQRAAAALAGVASPADRPDLALHLPEGPVHALTAAGSDHAFADAGAALASSHHLLPLELFQPDDPLQMRGAARALGR